MPTFTPPVVRVRKSRLHTISEGVTVLGTGGVFTEVRNPQQEMLDAADVAYRGGYIYLVNDDEAAALVAAGYTVS